MVPFSLERLVTESDTIVRGSVARQESHWDAAGRLIVTDVTLDVAETIKGEPAAQQTLRVAGGTVGDVTLTTSNDPRFEDGENLIAFLDTTVTPVAVVGLWQGKLVVEDGAVKHAGRRVPLADFVDEIRRRMR